MHCLVDNSLVSEVEIWVTLLYNLEVEFGGVYNNIKIVKNKLVNTYIL